MDTQGNPLGTDALNGLEVVNLSKRYGTTAVLSRFSLIVLPGELCCLLGPSGCGKTTVLRIVTGLLDPDEGKVFLNGRNITNIPSRKRNIGMVFQNYALFPHLDVFENTAYGLRRRKTPEETIRGKVADILALVRLDGFENRRIAELSGGEQQRVALARALVIKPDLLLLDEPLSNLDARLRADLREDLRRVVDELGITTLFVTHDQEEAMSIADRVAVLFSGKVVQQGVPQKLYDHPAIPFVADFLGRVNLIPAAVFEERMLFPAFPLSRPEGFSSAKGTALCALRPEKITLTRPFGYFPRGIVQKKLFLGPTIRYTIAMEGLERFLVVESPPDEEQFNPEEAVGISFSPDSVRFFREE